jgi:hypothetical protein
VTGGRLPFPRHPQSREHAPKHIVAIHRRERGYLPAGLQVPNEVKKVGPAPCTQATHSA